jgi:phage shock protein PspC (stress-responsive transcriptional regulator)
MNDIESRIAELFQEKMTKEEEVISMKLVNEVIEIMGDPDEIIDTSEEKTSGSKSSYSSSYHRGRSKRLYRDTENSVIGGVSSGLGAYFNIDPLIVRILFVVFLFVGGSSLLIYLILWIVLPKAETSAQKLEMRGEPVNVSNIEKKVKAEFKAAKENVKAAANSEAVKKTKKAANNFFSDFGKILLVFVKVILIIIGTGFVLAGIGIILGIVTGTFMGLHFFPFGDFNFSLGDLLSPFSDPMSITLLILSLSLLFLIPIIAMIYGLIKLIFSIKTKNRGLTIGATSLWFIALIMIVGILAIETGNYSDTGSSTSKSTLSVISDTLYISVNEHQKKEFEKNLAFDFDMDSKWYLTENLDRIYGLVDFDIERSEDNRMRIEVEKRSKGKNWDEADDNAANLKYNFSTKENKLILDPYFFIDGSEKWRFPHVEITLDVPEGKYIFIEKPTREILDDVYNTDHISDWRMGGKMWMMTEDGLTLVGEEE